MSSSRLHTFGRFALATLNPWRDDPSRAMFWTLGKLLTDPMAEVMRLGGWLRFGLWPEGLYPPDAIPVALRLLGLPVYRTAYDAPDAYAEGRGQIADRWASHAAAGTPDGLVTELVRVGLPDPALSIPDPAGSQFTLQSSAFAEGTGWGAGDWDTFTWDVSGVPLEQAERVAQCIAFWRPARSFCVIWELP
jgi:hypothetical protein